MSAPIQLVNNINGGPLSVTQGEDYYYSLTRFTNTQSVTLVNATTGTFALAIGGKAMVGEVPYNVNAVTLTYALAAIPGVGADKVVVSGTNPNFLVTLTGGLDNPFDNPITAQWIWTGLVVPGLVPFDLTGWHAHLRMDDTGPGGTNLVDITDTPNSQGEILLNTPLGLIQWHVKASVTALWTFTDRAQLDLELTSPTGQIIFLATAQVALVRTVFP